MGKQGEERRRDVGKGMKGEEESRGGREGTREVRGVSRCSGTPATCLYGLILELQGIRELHWAQQSSHWDVYTHMCKLTTDMLGPHFFPCRHMGTNRNIIQTDVQGYTHQSLQHTVEYTHRDIHALKMDM